MAAIKRFVVVALMFILVLPVSTRGDNDTANTQVKVADLLDQIIQPRFEVNAGVFGLSRLITFIGGHDSVDSPSDTSFAGSVRACSPVEQRLLDRANSYQHDYLIGFVHTTHMPGKRTVPGGALAASQLPSGTPVALDKPAFSTLAVSNSERQVFVRMQGFGQPSPEVAARLRLANENQKSVVRLEAAAINALSKNNAGTKVDVRVDRWLAALRPVRASSQVCLNCHTGAKKGDTLGVMVYAINNGIVTPTTHTARRE